MVKWMVSLVNSHTNATRIGWHMWEIDLRFVPGLSPGWTWMSISWRRFFKSFSVFPLLWMYFNATTCSHRPK